MNSRDENRTLDLGETNHHHHQHEQEEWGELEMRKEGGVGYWENNSKRIRTSTIVVGVLVGGVVLTLWTLLMVGWGISMCEKDYGCSVCSLMTSEIHKHSLDLNEVGDTPENEQLFKDATTMHSLWIVPVGDYVNEAKAIIGFSFGQGPIVDGTPTPGGTNEALAWSIMYLLDEYEAAGVERPQVMVQWEIGQVLWEQYGVAANVTASVDTEGNYLSTYGVMEQFTGPLNDAGISTIALVAHPDHAVRCGKVVQHFEVTALGTKFLRADGGIPWDQFGCDQGGYDPTSTQPWCADRLLYLRHELRARPDMYSQGQIDFSNDNFRG